MPEYIKIGRAPAVLYGEPAERAFLFVHGLCGNKEEAQRFAAVVNPLGWQALAVDLPGHNGRQDGVRLVPWEAVPELQNVRNYMKERWRTLGVRAVSLGAWLALQAFAGERVERCLLSSPLLDMEKMICSMMAQAGISEERLRAEGEIPVPGGQTLSWHYLCWAREHPVSSISPKTALLYGAKDEMSPRSTIDAYCRKFACSLTVAEGATHWFHTPEEMARMSQWEREQLEK